MSSRPDMVSVLSKGESPCARKALRDLKWRQRQTGKTEYELEINADTYSGTQTKPRLGK